MLRETREDLLIESPLHKVLVFFNLPAGRPLWQLMAVAAGAVISVWAVWWLAAGPLAAVAALLLAFFLLADAALLTLLPRLGLSFGAWASQLFALGLPRLLLTLLLALPAVWLGGPFSLGLLLAVQLLGSALLLYGTFIEPFRLQMSELKLETAVFPAGAPPLRLLHISDLHIERLTRREERLLQLVEETQPDIIVMTGDYLNISYVDDPQAQADVRRLLSRLSAPLGVYATLGSPTVDQRLLMPALFDGLAIHLLRDEWRTIEAGPGRRLHLLGLDCSHDLENDGRCLADLMSRAPNDGVRILLYHSPELMPEASAQPIKLYLCGHTHGGQVRLPIFGALATSSQLGKRYEMGHYEEQGTHLFISRGVGLEGMSAPRVRFLAPPEVTLVVLA